MSSTPQDPKDEGPTAGTSPEDAPPATTPETTPEPTPSEPTAPAETTPPTGTATGTTTPADAAGTAGAEAPTGKTAPPPPAWVTGSGTTSTTSPAPVPAPAAPTTPAPSAAPTTPTPPTSSTTPQPTTASDEPEAPGLHAAPRPYPPSAPQVERTTTRPTGFEGAIARERPTTYAQSGLPPQSTAPMPAAPPATTPTPVGATPTVETTPPPAGTVTAGTVIAAPDDRPRRELPEPPAKPGIGRHLLAGVLGLVLTPFAMLLVGVGTSRLADIAGTSDMGTDMLGASLLALGLALLAVIVLLGAWSAVLPIVGGLVWGIGLGSAYLAVPGAMEDWAEAMTSDGSVPVAIEQLADAGMSGYLLVLGTLLVTAGIATAIARRRGRRWAEQTAEARRAREDAAREDAEQAGRAEETRTLD